MSKIKKKHLILIIAIVPWAILIGNGNFYLKLLALCVQAAAAFYVIKHIIKEK
jgi:hypothetical protein